MDRQNMKAPEHKPGMTWQQRSRGYWAWSKLAGKPDAWYLQCEYRALNKDGQEIWRSPKHPSYHGVEKPPRHPNEIVR